MRVLVTGATGTLGSHIIDDPAAAEHYSRHRASIVIA